MSHAARTAHATRSARIVWAGTEAELRKRLLIPAAATGSKPMQRDGGKRRAARLASDRQRGEGVRNGASLTDARIGINWTTTTRWFDRQNRRCFVTRHGPSPCAAT
jgi:hypothetical protein